MSATMLNLYPFDDHGKICMNCLLMHRLEIHFDCLEVFDFFKQNFYKNIPIFLLRLSSNSIYIAIFCCFL